MDSFRCLRLSVSVQAEEYIRLPAYQGSALRGAFGHALKRSVCAAGNQTCDACILKSQCIYSYAFETPPPENSKVLRNFTSVPHPFIINPITGESGIYEPGMSFCFGMTLVGRAIEYVPYFVYAFMRMGEQGIGSGKGRFRVLLVNDLDINGSPVETIYENEILKTSETVLSFHDAEEMAKQYDPHNLTLQFITPVRVKYQGKLCDDLQFHVLIRNLARRLSNLLCFHCGQDAELPFKELIEKAESVRLVRNNTRWYDWTRYSGRQKKRMQMGGVLGEATYEGVAVGEFLPLLVLGSWVNMGKGTSFGLGNYILHN